MDRSTLSKRKYIYRVYEDAVNCVHIARYRIAYINSLYVYYIPGDKQRLECIDINSRVQDSLEEYMEWNADNGRDPMSSVTYMYYWSISESDPEAVRKSLMEKYKTKNRERAISRAQTAIQIAEGELARAKKRLEELQKCEATELNG